jgi:hypothetical protein
MMTKARIWAVLPLVAAIAGCQMDSGSFGGSGGSWQGSGGSGGFGGSGGSGQAGISLGRDACMQEARRQGLNIARIHSVREYGAPSPRGVQVRMQIRRSAMSVNTEPRVCRFSYSSGEANISRT